MQKVGKVGGFADMAKRSLHERTNPKWKWSRSVLCVQKLFKITLNTSLGKGGSRKDFLGIIGEVVIKYFGKMLHFC